MKLKTYTAENLDKALDQVRDELGSDAVIVQTKRVKSGGFLGFFQKEHMEVVAALSETKPKEVPVEEVAATVTSPVVEPLIDNRPPARDVRYDKVLVEMKELKELLYDQTKAPKLPKLLREFDDDLKQQGVHSEARMKLIAAILEHQGDKRVTASALLQNVRKAFDELEYAEPEYSRILCFSGPTGVGKTTTIAKWATEEFITKKRKVGLVTTDTFRIGAVEQLKTYASILGVPLEVVTDVKDMGPALERLKDCERILIDTAGRNFQQEQFIDEVRAITSYEEMTTQLVLSLTASYPDSQKLIQSFEQVGFTNIIATKLDETSQPGHLLNLMHDYSYPISYVTTGQHVPHDIRPFNSMLLREVFLGEETSHGSSSSTS
ncbi:flagellar biosynthesis protein FlhF [Chryseomicrobium palamuruense]|uniref:Flagellar biosynthesis protein FlhF n=1 Tax=Chryseomicrobium palamuruense TaxID=682973 RepID=A0ABV8UVC2_9BACL